MNLTPRWGEPLIEAGYEAIHWSQVGANNAPDTELMEWADQHGAVVLTKDLDFGDILAANKKASPSVVILRTEEDLPEEISNLVIQAITEAKAILDSGAIVIIKASRTKLRILPIGVQKTDYE